jgi:outer membrane protein assembly factor BamB
MGAMALCPAGDFRFDRSVADGERLEKGPGEPSKVAPLETSPKDWPTYRGNNAHNASSQASLPKKPIKKWETEPQRGVTPTLPTAADGLVFLGGDDGKVRALSAQTGQTRWSFLTAGPIRVAPTISNSRAYVGSGDGYVYCLEAATGRLLWRFRAAPVERRIMVYERLCSNWPVNTGVLVQDGIAYVGAGLIDTDGTYVYALDAATGAVKWQNNSSGHLNKTIRKGVSAHGRLAIAGGKLWMAGGNVVSPAVYDLKTGECLNKGPVLGPPQTNRGEEVGVFNDKYMLAGGRLLFSAFENVVDPGYFDMIKNDLSGGSYNFIVGKIPPAWDDKSFLYVNGRRSSLRCRDVEAIEKSFGKGREAEATIKKRWVADVPWMFDTVSLAIARNAVVAVCETMGAPPLAPNPAAVKAVAFEQAPAASAAPERPAVRDIAPDRPKVAGAAAGRLKAKQAAPGAEVPLRPAMPRPPERPALQRPAAPGGAPGWAVVLLDPKDGKVLWRDNLPSRPFSGGLLIDRDGQIVVVLENGQIICFGKEKGVRLLAQEEADVPGYLQ